MDSENRGASEKNALQEKRKRVDKRRKARQGKARQINTRVLRAFDASHDGGTDIAKHPAAAIPPQYKSKCKYIIHEVVGIKT